MRSSLDTSGMQATRLSTSFATSAVGCSSARPFSAYSRSAASSLRASATNPYTVSNGRTTGRPAWTAATASATVLSSPPFDHPLDAGEVARDLRLGVTVFAQCLFDLSRLAVADLEHEPGRPRRANDLVVQAGVGEGVVWLPLQLRLGFGECGLCDVGRVCDDQVPALPGRLRACASKLDAKTEPLGVLAGELERLRRRVDAGDSGGRNLVGDRKRNCAAADSDVEDARPRLVRGQRARALDHALGLGTRQEGAPVRVRRHPPEPPLAQHVGQRFTLFPPPGQAFELVLVDVAVLVDARPGNAEDVRDEPFGIDTRRVDSRCSEPALDLRERVANRHSPSARRRSSEASASVNSSRPPWRMRSSWCTVSLMRWSVSRFSGKLYVRIFSARSPEPI